MMTSMVVVDVVVVVGFFFALSFRRMRTIFRKMITDASR